MAENGKDFELEHLDQQIEQPAHYLDVPAGHLVEGLQTMYHAQPHESRADVESLLRVRKLLQERVMSTRPETNIVKFAEIHKSHERKSSMIDIKGDRQMKARSGGRRLARIFTTLVAVLVVALLVGSAAVFFNLQKRAQEVQPSTNVGSANNNATKQLPKLDCSHVFSDPDIPGHPDNGEHAVCLQKLETPLQGTTTVKGHKVTLISAYADANRLLFVYSIMGKHVSIPSGGVTLGQTTIQGGTKLSEANAGGYYYDQSHQQTIYLSSFDTQSVSASTTTLQVKAEFFALNIGTANDGESSSLSFTVPLQAAKRVVTLNQSVVLNGYHLTLTNLRMTASMTIITIKSSPVLPGAHSLALLTTVNGDDSSVGVLPSNASKMEPLTGLTITVIADYMHRTSNAWTIHLNSQGEPLGPGQATISFTL
jgi:hypothetical protein